jgi:hypothetical protein
MQKPYEFQEIAYQLFFKDKENEGDGVEQVNLKAYFSSVNPDTLKNALTQGLSGE